MDTIALHDHMHLLRPVFADPATLKVLHGAQNDCKWLQRDFHIYIVNMFDTQKAAQVLFPFPLTSFLPCALSVPTFLLPTYKCNHPSTRTCARDGICLSRIVEARLPLWTCRTRALSYRTCTHILLPRGRSLTRLKCAEKAGTPSDVMERLCCHGVTRHLSCPCDYSTSRM